MNIKNQELIRNAKLVTGITSSLIFSANDMIGAANICALPYFVDVLSANSNLKKTDEYQEIEENYQVFIKNVTNFMQSLGIKDVTDIFACYVYMYRQGYFSYNHYFEYNPDLKDLPCLNGLDVILGKGVCRSIAAMLFDIYKSFGYKTDFLAVKTNGEVSSHLQKLSPVKLIKNVKKNNIFYKISASAITANHLILGVSDGENIYILDPTGDGMMYVNGQKFLVPNSAYFMKNCKFNIWFARLFEMYQKGNLTKDDYHLPSLPDDVYREGYLHTLKICRENQSNMAIFSNDNEELYNLIYNLGNRQSNLVQRVIPVLKK